MAQELLYTEEFNLLGQAIILIDNDYYKTHRRPDGYEHPAQEWRGFSDAFSTYPILKELCLDKEKLKRSLEAWLYLMRDYSLSAIMVIKGLLDQLSQPSFSPPETDASIVNQNELNKKEMELLGDAVWKVCDKAKSIPGFDPMVEKLNAVKQMLRHPSLPIFQRFNRIGRLEDAITKCLRLEKAKYLSEMAQSGPDTTPTPQQIKATFDHLDTIGCLLIGQASEEDLRNRKAALSSSDTKETTYEENDTTQVEATPVNAVSLGQSPHSFYAPAKPMDFRTKLGVGANILAFTAFTGVTLAAMLSAKATVVTAAAIALGASAAFPPLTIALIVLAAVALVTTAAVIAAIAISHSRDIKPFQPTLMPRNFL